MYVPCLATHDDVWIFLIRYLELYDGDKRESLMDAYHETVGPFAHCIYSVCLLLPLVSIFEWIFVAYLFAGHVLFCLVF